MKKIFLFAAALLLVVGLSSEYSAARQYYGAECNKECSRRYQRDCLQACNSRDHQCKTTCFRLGDQCFDWCSKNLYNPYWRKENPALQ